MMDEVAAIRMRVDPTEVILIADARTGQDAVCVAEEVIARVPLSRGVRGRREMDVVVRTGLCCGGPPSPRTGVTSPRATG
jgi:signal recognition particle GTPase